MTLKELLEKNAKARNLREAMAHGKKRENAVAVEEKLEEEKAKMPEELPAACECEKVLEEKKDEVPMMEDQPLMEEKPESELKEVEEIPAVKKPAAKKSTGKKPANRQYMVVEDVEKANEEE